MQLPPDVVAQVGPCGITCGTCPLGNGSVAKTAKATSEYIKMSGIKDWASMTPEGANLNWAEAEKALSWMTKYAYCAGCEKGGGPPDCAIRLCTRERKHELCSTCQELDSCTRFNWLGDASGLKKRLRENAGKTKSMLCEEAIRESSARNERGP